MHEGLPEHPPADAQASWDAYHDEMLRTFARGVAHNFNNILTAGMGFLSLAMENVTDHETLALLRNVELCHHRITHLSRQLLSFSGDEEPKPAVVRLYDVLRNALILFDSIALKRRAVLVCDFHPIRDVLIEIDEFRFLQVLVEVLKNAAEAVQAGRGTIQFCARNNGERVCIEIRDDGAGMEPEELERIFAPFYTSKQIVGVGLGLSIARSVVERFGGTLELTSSKGQGTCVRIALPVKNLSVESDIAAGTAGRGLRKDLRVLIAVDSDQVRLALEALLGAQNFHVDTADFEEDMIEALQHGRGYDLIIADLLHSDFFADSLVELIRKHSQAAILTLHTAAQEKPSPADGVRSLAKPFDPAGLMDVLRAFPQLLCAGSTDAASGADAAGSAADSYRPEGGRE